LSKSEELKKLIVVLIVDVVLQFCHTLEMVIIRASVLFIIKRKNGYYLLIISLEYLSQVKV